MLKGILSTCNAALHKANTQKACVATQSATCAATKLGILVKAMNRLRIHALSDDTSPMKGSVFRYWEGLKDLTDRYRDYEVYDRSGRLRCNFERCLGGFDILDRVRLILEKHMHPAVWAQLEKVSRSPSQGISFTD